MPPASPLQQRTLAQPVSLQGVGLHTGEIRFCCLSPAPIDTGRIFVRTDQPDYPPIPARIEAVVPAQLSTRLQQGEAEIQTVEHLLAALVGLGIDNCRIEIDGPELPILDGSAMPFVEAISAAGIRAQEGYRSRGVVKTPVTVWQRDAFVTAIPGSGTRYTYGVDYPNSPIQDQWFSWEMTPSTFIGSIAPARTFTRERDIEQARQYGLIKGGSLDNAIVCSETDWHTPLRFPNEPVRHKLIDLLGDLSLLGLCLQGHILAYKAGHALHHQLLQKLQISDSLEIHKS